MALLRVGKIQMSYLVRYGSKYGAKKTVYNGRRYDSKLDTIPNL
jgi:hypothetical protein